MFPKRWLLVWLGVCAAWSILWLLAEAVWDPLYLENGVMENAQAVGLGFGLLAFLASSWRERGGAKWPLLFCGVALLHLTLLVLEVDLRGHVVAPVERVLNGRIRDLWLAGLWLAWGVFAWRGRRLFYRTVAMWLSQRSGGWMAGAGVFWVLGGLIDKAKLFGRERSLLGEELMEMNAVLCMVLAAAWAWRETARSRDRMRESRLVKRGAAEEI